MSNPKYIMSRANKSLSNRADGANSETVVLMNQEARVEKGVANHITINVENDNGSYDLNLALIPAGFDTNEVVNTITKDKADKGQAQIDVVTGISSKIVPSNPAELVKAGFNVGAVLHDTGSGYYEDTDGSVKVKMSSGDPTRTLNEFLRYIKMNPVRLKNLEIYSTSAQALASSLNLTFVNPFFKNAVQSIDLSTFFDLYQYNQNRIKVDFSGNELELSDLTLLTAVIPSKTSVQYIMRFA